MLLFLFELALLYYYLSSTVLETCVSLYQGESVRYNDSSLLSYIIPRTFLNPYKSVIVTFREKPKFCVYKNSHMGILH